MDSFISCQTIRLQSDEMYLADVDEVKSEMQLQNAYECSKYIPNPVFTLGCHVYKDS